MDKDMPFILSSSPGLGITGNIRWKKSCTSLVDDCLSFSHFFPLNKFHVHVSQPLFAKLLKHHQWHKYYSKFKSPKLTWVFPSKNESLQTKSGRFGWECDFRLRYLGLGGAGKLVGQVVKEICSMFDGSYLRKLTYNNSDLSLYDLQFGVFTPKGLSIWLKAEADNSKVCWGFVFFNVEFSISNFPFVFDSSKSSPTFWCFEAQQKRKNLTLESQVYFLFCFRVIWMAQFWMYKVSTYKSICKQSGCTVVLSF